MPMSNKFLLIITLDVYIDMNKLVSRNTINFLTKIAVVNSSRTLCSAPTSSHVTSGTFVWNYFEILPTTTVSYWCMNIIPVAKPSRLLDGLTHLVAWMKSFWVRFVIVSNSFAISSEVSISSLFSCSKIFLIFVLIQSIT